MTTQIYNSDMQNSQSSSMERCQKEDTPPLRRAPPKPPHYSVRPEDKAIKMLFTATEEPTCDSLDEFLSSELSNFQNIDDQPTFDEHKEYFPEHLLKLEQGKGSLSHMVTESPPQPWRKGLWCLTQRGKSELVVGKTRKPRLDEIVPVVSPSHLFTNENASPRYHRCSPTRPDTMTSPSPCKSKVQELKLTCESLSGTQGERSNPVQTSCSVNDYQSLYESQRVDGLDLEDDIPIQNHFPLPKAPQGRPSGKSPNKDLSKRNNGAFAPSRAATFHGRVSLRPTISTSTFDNPMLTMDYADIVTSHDHVVPDQPMETNVSKHPRMYNEHFPPPRWTPESLHSSDSSHQSYKSRQPYLSQGVLEPVRNTEDAWPQGWTSPTVPPAHIYQTNQMYYSDLAQPAPRRAPHQVLQHQANVPNGLGINLDSVEGISKIQIHDTLAQQANVLSPASPTRIQRNTTQFNPLLPYPPLPPLPGHWKEDSPFDTPHRRVKSTSRSPSPPVSPTRANGRSLRQRSPTRTDYSNQRRKSLHQHGPIKDGSGKSSRARSASRPPRTPKTPKTPKTPGGGFGQIDFVNFTPKDAVKLLSDVAPSGSSKTRHRREQEARDKRKKLSEAALQAVRRAGGDVAALEEAFFHGVSDED